MSARILRIHVFRRRIRPTWHDASQSRRGASSAPVHLPLRCRRNDRAVLLYSDYSCRAGSSNGCCASDFRPRCATPSAILRFVVHPDWRRNHFVWLDAGRAGGLRRTLSVAPSALSLLPGDRSSQLLVHAGGHRSWRIFHHCPYAAFGEAAFSVKLSAQSFHTNSASWNSCELCNRFNTSALQRSNCKWIVVPLRCRPDSLAIIAIVKPHSVV